MNKEFIPYQEALELKSIGFDEECFGYYNYKKELRKYTIFNGELNDFHTLKNNQISLNDGWCTAPTYSQCFRWFREKHKIGTWIHHYFNMDKGNFEYSWVITLPYKDNGYVYDAYEEAELACLRQLITIITQPPQLNIPDLILEPILAEIEHINEVGTSKWFEVVYYDNGWHCYASSKTFKDGEKVIKWKYAKNCL